jgi:hypothetical protein
MISITATYNPATSQRMVAFNSGNYGAQFIQGPTSPCGFAVAGTSGTYLDETCATGVGADTTDLTLGDPVLNSYFTINAKQPGNATILALGQNNSPVFSLNSLSGGWTLYDYAGGAGSPAAGITQSSGVVGMGGLTPSMSGYSNLYSLNVGGNGVQVLGSSGVLTTSLSYSSDRTLKTDIQPLTQELERILSMRPVSFEWNEKAKARGLTAGGRHLGFIAQEVEGLFPEVVKTAPDGIKSVDYVALVAPLAEALQDLERKNAALEAENRDLEKRLDRLEKGLESH